MTCGLLLLVAVFLAQTSARILNSDTERQLYDTDDSYYEPEGVNDIIHPNVTSTRRPNVGTIPDTNQTKCTFDAFSREELKEQCRKLDLCVATWKVILYSIIGTLIAVALFCGACSCLFLPRQEAPDASTASVAGKSIRTIKTIEGYAERVERKVPKRSPKRPPSPKRLPGSKEAGAKKAPASKYPFRLNDPKTKSISTAEVAFWSPKDSGGIQRSLSKEFFELSKTKTVINPATKSPVIIHRPAPPPPTTRISPDRAKRPNIVRPAPPPPLAKLSPKRQQEQARHARRASTPVRAAPPPPKKVAPRDEPEPPATPRSPIGSNNALDSFLPVKPKRRRKKDYDPQMPI